MAYMTCVAYMDFFIIFILFYFILLQVFEIIFLGLLGMRKRAIIYLEGESTEF